MAQKNAAELFKAVKLDQALKQKIKAASNPEAFIKIAEEHGYNFTVEESGNIFNSFSCLPH